VRVVVGWVGFGSRCWRMMTARARAAVCPPSHFAPAYATPRHWCGCPQSLCCGQFACRQTVSGAFQPCAQSFGRTTSSIHAGSPTQPRSVAWQEDQHAAAGRRWTWLHCRRRHDETGLPLCFEAGARGSARRALCCQTGMPVQIPSGPAYCQLGAAGIVSIHHHVQVELAASAHCLERAAL